MPFRTPNMPLTAGIWGRAAGPPPIGVAPRVTTPCQLRFLKTAQLANSPFWVGRSSVLLLVPKLTDVRMYDGTSSNEDYVEVPLGSGRWYDVLSVDDVAKGFPNEYRVASLVSLNVLVGTWPTPYP
jgi:hypothetical protein